jgi:hypothetical protein
MSGFSRFADIDGQEERRVWWGLRAGETSYYTGVSRSNNPFMDIPNMPMHDCWYMGWDAARKGLKLNVVRRQIGGTDDQKVRTGPGRTQGCGPCPALTTSGSGTVSDE